MNNLDKYRDEIELQVRFNAAMPPGDVADAIVPILERALAQQTERADRAEANRDWWKGIAEDYRQSARRFQVKLRRVRELRDEAEVTPDGYVIDRGALDAVLEWGDK